MGKMKMYAAISLDGFTARTNGDIDFILKYTQGNDYGFRDYLKTIDCVIMNQRYYNELLSYDLRWQYADLPCYILSDNAFKTPINKNIRILKVCERTKEGYAAHISELQKQHSTIWLAGDRELITYCLEHNIIDEITLVVCPVTLGNGNSLFLGTARENDWEVIDSRVYENGVIKVCYRKRSENTNK